MIMSNIDFIGIDALVEKPKGENGFETGVKGNLV